MPKGNYKKLSFDRVAARLPHRWLTAGTQTILDLSLFTAALLVSYLLRFDFHIPRGHFHNFVVQAPLIVLLQLIALTVAGGRNFIWRYTGMDHVKPFIYAAAVFIACVASMRLFFSDSHQTWRVPLSIILFDAALAFGGAFLLRVLRRSIYERQKRRGQIRAYTTNGKTRRPVLLIGAGQAGVLAANEIEGRGDLDLEIKGFIDDDRTKVGRRVVKGHRVLGTTKDMGRLVRSLGVDHVVITIAQASRSDLQRITKICEEIPIKVRIIPGLYELLDGRVEISLIRDVQIEDLLGRDPVQLDAQSISNELTGKTVMVTGAGGSIGSELARQVIRFSPARLLLVERAEFALFNIDRTLKEWDSTGSLVPLVADIGDAPRMRAIFQTYRPDVVIHAAAHKHVALMETNPCEAMKNNVLNTLLLSELASEFKAEAFVMISSDKAVRPTSIMGASKRVAELIVQDVGSRSKTRFVAVRFGNVIGSNGSAIPIFQEQIRNGGPITITDKRMRRYFMTIPEAAQLVLQASTIGNGGEVFILHMGDPVNILELAEALISLSGMKPHEDIQIVEIGIRPGEKLCEELTFESEAALATSHPKIFISRLAPIDTAMIQFGVKRLQKLVDERDEVELRRFLGELIPEAQLNSSAKNTAEWQAELSRAAHAIF
ncbi:MAG TPA: nucleoside-diphosphate sugar epimerase/dehydratase [Pyrinomonadaceae bacterium]|nr:nucleoside-diphosphate sugar epimerase/dehydratase [Pyrinomonadaceae bacterium]